MLNVYFFKIRFFYLRKIDIRLKNGTVFVTSSVEHEGLNCHNAELHIA